MFSKKYSLCKLLETNTETKAVLRKNLLRLNIFCYITLLSCLIIKFKKKSKTVNIDKSIPQRQNINKKKKIKKNLFKGFIKREI